METIDSNVRAAPRPSPAFAAGVAGAVLAPLVFYPSSKTLWVAIEVIMRPVEAVEPADART